MSVSGTDDGQAVPDHQRSLSRATQASQSTARSTIRVVTIPAWARNLPADDFPDDDEFDEPSWAATAPPSRPLGQQRRKSIASLLRTPTFSSSNNTPTIGTPNLAGASGSPRQPVIRRTSASDGGSPPSASTANLQQQSQPAAQPQEDKPHSTPPAPPAPALNPQDTRRAGAGAGPGHPSSHGGGGDKWWTFTLPTKHLHHQADLEKGKLKERSREASSDEEHSDDEPAEVSEKSDKERRNSKAKKRKSDYHKKMSLQINQQLAPPGVFSMNQTQTPGWSAPWTPFHRTDSRANADPFAAVTAPAKKKKSKFEVFVLENVFAPLVFRAINLALNVCTLGLASHIRLQEYRNAVIGVMGSSTLMAVVVAPLAITHIFINLYIEYFGRPIGLWRIRTKMTHTFSELIFICLWSSVLSLAFDDLFTSSLECTAYTPYRRYNSPPTNIGSSSIEGTLADQICSQQIAIVTFVMLIVAVYILVLVVSLFRIFAKVSRKS